MTTPQVLEELVRQLALSEGLELPRERILVVAGILQRVAAGVAAFDELELEGVEPELAFSARWD